MYKYASTMNEFETFTKFPEAMHHKNLVQVCSGWCLHAVIGRRNQLCWCSQFVQPLLTRLWGDVATKRRTAWRDMCTLLTLHGQALASAVLTCCTLLLFLY